MTTQPQNYNGLAWIAALAFFMQALDGTILNTALPAISTDLNESPLEMQMAIISYVLTVAALIPLSGWLADRFGTLKVFRVAIGLFVLGSVASAMANSLNALVIARILQGVGGAMMVPVSRLAIIRMVPKNELVSVWNLMATAGLLGPVLGPVVGGWLVTHTSWHWIFLINIPIGVFGILVAGKYMQNLTQEPTPFDGLGFLMFAGSLVCFTLGLELIAEDLHLKWKALALASMAGVLMTAYIFHSRRISYPILSLNLFKVRTFRIGMIAFVFIRLCNAGVPFLMPLMLQVVYGYDADIAGRLIAPMALGALLVKRIVGATLYRFGHKRVMLVNALAMSIAIASLSNLNSHSSMWLISLQLLICGVCNSFIFTSINTLTIGDLNDKQASAGSTFLSVMQQMGIALGIAAASVILSLFRNTLGGSQTELEQAFAYTFISIAAFGLVLFAVLLCLRDSDGASMKRKQPSDQ